MRPPGRTAPLCARCGASLRGSRGAGPHWVLGPRAAAALVRGMYDTPLRTAPAWVWERAAAAGWRPLPAAPPLPF